MEQLFLKKIPLIWANVLMLQTNIPQTHKSLFLKNYISVYHHLQIFRDRLRRELRDSKSQSSSRIRANWSLLYYYIHQLIGSVAAHDQVSENRSVEWSRLRNPHG